MIEVIHEYDPDPEKDDHCVCGEHRGNVTIHTHIFMRDLNAEPAGSETPCRFCELPLSMGSLHKL